MYSQYQHGPCLYYKVMVLDTLVICTGYLYYLVLYPLIIPFYMDERIWGPNSMGIQYNDQGIQYHDLVIQTWSILVLTVYGIIGPYRMVFPIIQCTLNTNMDHVYTTRSMYWIPWSL